MGAAASVDEAPSKPIVLKALPDALEHCLYVDERWPLVLDPTEQASRFLRYQRGCFLLGESQQDMERDHLRRLLVGCLKCGSTMCLAYSSVDTLRGLEAAFEDNFFPREILDKRQLFREDVWKTLLRPDQGDPEPHEFLPRDDFALVVVVGKGDPRTLELPEDVRDAFSVVAVGETPAKTADRQQDADDALADSLGAREVRRNSADMVEHAFENEIDDVKRLIEQGFYVDSVDARDNTPLSDAAAQGHGELVTYLLELGADPNSQSDLGRTPLWRAAFGGFSAMCTLLLKSGADPSITNRDFERPFDIASNEETRAVLEAWDEKETRRLLKKREKQMELALQERLKTAAQREAHARDVLRKEVVGAATAGDVAQLQKLLDEVVEFATTHKERPRCTANTARDERGGTCLHLAAQHGHVELCAFLLTHHGTIDPPTTQPGDESVAAKVFWTNPNRRDAKGWTPLAVAIFCDQKKCAELLLAHGADPTIANSFGHTAYDLAKDQIAGDERTVLKDKSEVRAVLEEYDAERRAERRRPSKDAAPADPLPPEGSAVAMQLEVVADAKAREGASESKVATALAAKKFAKKAKKTRKSKKGGAKKKS